MAGAEPFEYSGTTNHIDLYDQAEYVDPAIDRITDWMAEYL